MKPIIAGAALLVFLWLAPALSRSARADELSSPAATDAAAAEDEKQRLVAERFLAVLEKNPRRGTALDRLYGYHVEAGSLDRFVKRFTDRAAADPTDGTAWMLLGLIEAQRGHDAAAVEAFRRAETHLAENALASFYLGQSLALVGQPDEAAAAFERAIGRKPARADLLEVFQALGRVYQRAQKGDQALAVWSRLEKLFPDDSRVGEQIATTLVEEGQYEQALPRFEALAEKSKDDYRTTSYRIESADLKVRLGRSKEGLADFEGLLSRLNPDNWLYRDVRRRIDDIYLRNDDQAGLAAYYEDWVGKHADDVEAIARLARLLAGSGRTPEAREWLDKALKRAPTRKDLRLALIDHLVAEKRFTEAIAQYEILAKNEPGNPDFLREWGRLILRDMSQPETARKSAAAAVWRKLLEARPKDSLTATQVADLFRQAEMPDEALELYRQAVELSPEATQYREYLGEFFFTQKQKDAALESWREIAAGKRRNPENLARLAEVLSGFGFIDEAVDNIFEACKLDDDEFKYPVKAADLLAKAERYDAALGQLDVAMKLASNAEEVEVVVQRRIRNLQLSDGFERAINSLRSDLATGRETSAEQWFLLARYHDAARQLPEAARAIGKALALDEKSIPYRTAQARIHEASGNLQDATDAYRRLAAIDRRMRTEHLTHVARLEAQRGRAEQALAAGRDLLAAAPGNPEHYEFFAQLCFQLGKVDDGLEALRRSVRLNPAEPKAMLNLAAALAERFRTDEAIELYWRAFEKTPALDARVAAVSKLAELYLQTNHFDRLIERFECERREPDRNREMTICLAQVYHTAGDYGTARQELERLLTESSRDTQLLQQLANLSETEGDLPAAIKYHQQLLAAAPSRETETHLAQLLSRAGEYEEASTIWSRLAAEETDPARLIGTLDNLLEQNKHQLVLSITSRLGRNQPRNWELLYREGLALAATNKAEAATANFRAILASSLPDDEPGAQLRARQQSANRPHTAAAGAPDPDSEGHPLFLRLGKVSRFRATAGLAAAGPVSIRPTPVRPVGQSSPEDLGQARMASLASLLKLAETAGTRDAFIEEMRPAPDATRPDLQPLWNWHYLQLVGGNQNEIQQSARRLSQTGDPLGQWLWLWSQSSIGRINSPVINSTYGGSNPNAVATIADGDLDHTLACFRSLTEKRPELLLGEGYTSLQILNDLLAQFRQAHRVDDEAEIYRSLVAAADRLDARGIAMQLAAGRNDLQTSIALFDKIADEMLATPARRLSRSPVGFSLGANALTELISKRTAEGAADDAFRLFDIYANFVQRRLSAAGPAALRGNSRRRITVSTQPMLAGSAATSAAAAPGGIAGTGAIRTVRFVLPQANEHYDTEAISALRQTFAYFKRDGMAADLLDRCRARAESAQAADQLWWRLTLAYAHWWNEDRDSAAIELAAATELAPTDESLRLDLAELHESRGDPESALAVADSINPHEHNLLQERELLVLRVAGQLGDAARERAVKAAERLAGMRLDSVAQVELAAQIQQLGLRELAGTVLGRVQRQAGSRIPTLVALMRQYQADKKTDLAVQVAQQILRRSPPTTTPTAAATVAAARAAASTSLAASRAATSTAAIRLQAIQVLTRSGKLDELIERAEGQLKASPQSIVLYQTLVEYYEAAGNRAKSLEMLKKMAELRPDDARLQLQIGRQLVQSGQTEDAIAVFRTALRKDPSLFTQVYALFPPTATVVTTAGRPVMQRAAGPPAELLNLLDEVDLRTVGTYTQVYSMITRMQPAGGDGQRKSFGRLWQAFPENRARLLQYAFTLGSARPNAEGSAPWPELHDYCRETFIPRDAVSLADPWTGIGTAMTAAAQVVNGVVVRENRTIAGQFIDLAQHQGRLPELRGEVERTLAKFPEWRGGRPLLAMIHCASKESRLAVPLVREMLEDRQSPAPYAVWLAVAQALEEYEPMRQIALEVYEAAFEQPSLAAQSNSPLPRLVALFQQSGETAKARDLVLKMARQKIDPRYDPATIAQLRMQSVTVFAGRLLEMGYPLDAVRLYREVLDDENLASLVRQAGSAGDTAAVQHGYDAALAILDPELVASPMPRVPGQRSAPKPAARTDAQLKLLAASLLEPRAAASGGQTEMTLDLLLHVPRQPKQFEKLNSVVFKALRSAAESRAVLPEIRTRLADLLRQLPEDLPVAILACVPAFAQDQPEAIREAVERLAATVDRNPLEVLRPGAPASPSQRTAAARQIGVWLVARECLPRPELRARGEMLAIRAVEAARRQSDPQLALAILAEWGQIELVRDDKGAAESHWVDMLELVAPPVAAVSKAIPSDRPLPPALPDGVEPARAARGSSPRPPTPAQFRHAMDIAKLAAEHGLYALSMRCVRDALRAGPLGVNAQSDEGVSSGRIMIGGAALPAATVATSVIPSSGNSTTASTIAAASTSGTTTATVAARRLALQNSDIELRANAADVRVAELVKLWDQAGVPAVDQYEVLAAVVLPEARPREIFVFAQSALKNTPRRPASIVEMLAAAAVKAGRADDLRQRVAARQTQPLTKSRGQMILDELSRIARE